MIDGKKKGGISNENSERKTNISAMIREVVWTNSTITQISSTSNGVKNEDPISTTPQFSQLKETIVKSRISAVITSNIDNDLSLFDREEGEESREIRKDYRDRGNESMKEDEEEMKREGKIKMTVVKMERREKTEGASIHIPHQMEVDNTTKRRYTSSIFSSHSDTSPVSHSDVILNLKVFSLFTINH